MAERGRELCQGLGGRGVVRSVAVLLLVLGAGCAGATGAGTGGRTDEQNFVIQTVNGMVEALNARDTARFMAKVSDGYYRGYAQLEKRIQTAYGERLDFSLSATVGDIVVEETKISVAVRWKSRWVSKGSGEPVTAEGSGTLLFMKGMGLKLIDAGGETVFGF